MTSQPETISELALTTNVFRVLVVEDADKTLSAIQSQLEGSFERIDVLPASRARDAEALMNDFHIDAAILDIRLHGKDAGTDVVRVMTERAPRATTIIATRYRDRLAPFVGVTSPPIVKIVHKGDKGTGDDWAAEALKDAYREWEESRVAITNLPLAVGLLRDRAARIKGLREDDDELAFEIDRLLRRLFGWVHIDGLGSTTAVSVDLSRVKREGLSPAVTLRADVSLGVDNAGQRLSGSRVIVKIGPVADIRTETDRYHRFVKHGVPLIHRVELLGSAEDQSLGALCYSLAEDTTLDQALADDDWEQRAAVALYKLFDTPARSWYAVTGERMSAISYAHNQWQTDFSKCAKALEEMLRAIRTRFVNDHALIAEAPKEHVDGRLSLGPAKLRLPAQEFYTSEPFTNALPTCLIHGDMHGGNVMIETTSSGDVRPRLIDYGNVGPGPRLADFAALEASVRIADAQRISGELLGDVDGNGDALDHGSWSRALVRCATAEREERRLLRSWSGEQLKSEPKEQWSSISLRLANLASINFEGFDPEEYYAIAALVAYRHIGLEVNTLLRVRMAAWLSALYSQVAPPEEPT
jgi:CheY-like chemotaxis protein